MEDMNAVMLQYLCECPTIQENPIYFNFAQSQDNNQLFVTSTNTINEEYVDGSKLRRYQFTLFVYKSLSYDPVVKMEGYVKSHENVSEVADLQEILDWIQQQADEKNYPDFGTDCIIDNMKTATSNPVLYGTDVSVTPALAKYGMTVQIDYIDTSTVLFK
jgi:hypothetical protein